MSLAASAGVQRPPTPTVDFIAALFAAFSAVQSGSSNPPPPPEVEQAGSMAAARQMTNGNLINFPYSMDHEMIGLAFRITAMSFRVGSRFPAYSFL